MSKSTIKTIMMALSAIFTGFLLLWTWRFAFVGVGCLIGWLFSKEFWFIGGLVGFFLSLIIESIFDFKKRR